MFTPALGTLETINDVRRGTRKSRKAAAEGKARVEGALGPRMYKSLGFPFAAVLLIKVEKMGFGRHDDLCHCSSVCGFGVLPFRRELPVEGRC